MDKLLKLIEEMDDEELTEASPEEVWFEEYAPKQEGRVQNSKIFEDFTLWLDAINYTEERPSETALSMRISKIIEREGYPITKGRNKKGRYLFFPSNKKNDPAENK
jgi:hypothetical protein